MKQVILLSFLTISILPLKSQFSFATTSLLFPDYSSTLADIKEPSTINFQDEQGQEKMTAAIFKAQEYCRIELKDVDFDFPYKLINATVYFSGTNFKNIEKATITSTNLQPIKKLMDRCTAGSIVVFDNVQVKGPDNFLRTIPGLSLLLR